MKPKHSERSITMARLGTEQRPVIVKVNSEEMVDKVAAICDKYNLHFILGMEVQEDLTDLKRAVKNELEPDDPYSPCPCGSGKKYKFCCKKKMKNFDIHRFVADFEINP
jgi:uncharacterized protein YecA (UPF0149 family)